MSKTHIFGKITRRLTALYAWNDGNLLNMVYELYISIDIYVYINILYVELFKLIIQKIIEQFEMKCHQMHTH